MKERPIALVGGTVIDGSGKEPVEQSTVLIDGATIKSVETKDKAKLPQDCEIIDVSGKTIMPGLMDCPCQTLL